MCKINVKKSILEIVEKNNLEILKIDLVNSDEAFQNSSISFTIGKVYVCDIEFDPFLPYGEKRWYL